MRNSMPSNQARRRGREAMARSSPGDNADAIRVWILNSFDTMVEKKRVS